MESKAPIQRRIYVHLPTRRAYTVESISYMEGALNDPNEVKEVVLCETSGEVYKTQFQAVVSGKDFEKEWQLL